MVQPVSTPPASTPTALMTRRSVSAEFADHRRRAVERAERDHEIVVEPAAQNESRMKNTKLSRIGGDSSNRQPSSALSAASSCLRGWTARDRRLARASATGLRPRSRARPSRESAAPAHQALHEQQRQRRHRGAEQAGEGVDREYPAGALPAEPAARGWRSRPGDRPCWRRRPRANIATNTQNELTSPAIAKAREPSTRPQISMRRALDAVDEESGRRLQHASRPG